MNIRQHVRYIGFAMCGVILTGSILRAQLVDAATYYLAPSGSDSNSGTSATSPWKTFGKVFNSSKILKAGDTLILLDGTYDDSKSGYPNISCTSNANNGTVSAPITIKARNERRAWIKGKGLNNDVFKIANCSYWVIEGLHVSDVDRNNGNVSSRHGLFVRNSNHITIRRVLAERNNRYYNSHPIMLYAVHNSLIEDVEIYYFHRHGLSFGGGGTGNTIRRVYAHSRNYADIAGGYPSSGIDGAKGDTGITIYPGSNHVIENVIMENVANAVTLGHAINTTENNRCFGCIALNTRYGFVTDGGGSTSSTRPRNISLQNSVAINSSVYGVDLLSTVNGNLTNVSLFNGGLHGLEVIRDGQDSGGGAYSITGKNLLILNNKGSGVRITADIPTWTIDHAVVNGNGTNLNPSSSANYINVSTAAPTGLGSCKLWIPDGSSLKGAGKNGSDIGANILYRYENGVLTKTPLWDRVTAQFPCGAIVPGLNDITGSSCFDVHKRLNVNANGCSLPAGYGGQQSLSSPPNLRIVSP